MEVTQPQPHLEREQIEVQPQAEKLPQDDLEKGPEGPEEQPQDDHEKGPERPEEQRQDDREKGTPDPDTRATKGSFDAQGNWYPEGGLDAWLVAFGAFCSMCAGFGLLNTSGVFQAYVSANQLAQYGNGTVSWIFSVFAFLAFFCGVQIGPIFDARGPRALILLGSVCLVASMMVLGLCKEYYQFMLGYAVVGGVGCALVFTPAVSAVSHFFHRRRGQATGLATTGGSIGGVVFPLVFQRVLPQLGWAWATRILGFVVLVLTALGFALTRSRLPPRKGDATTWRDMLPDARIFGDGTGALALTTAGTFFMEWGYFVPITFLPSYAQANGLSMALSFQLLAIFNGGSFFGRWLPGYLADQIGPFNTQLMALALCFIFSLGLWLPAGGSVALVAAYAVLLGFTSGSNISLTPVCVGQLCATQEYGRYYATVYTLVAFGTLTGIPVAGALVNADGGSYAGLVLFSGLSYAASFVAFGAARLVKTGWRLMAVW